MPAFVQSYSQSQAKLMFATTQSWNGQLWLYQNECTFSRIHSLSMGGAHSRVEASIASPTFLSLMSLNNSRLCSTHNHLWILQRSTNNILRILVKAQPSTRGIWLWSPTRLGIWPQSVLATVASLLLLDTGLLSQGGIASNWHCNTLLNYSFFFFSI